MRWLALGGLVGPALFAAVVVVCAALRPGYSHAAQFISELGATGTAYAAVMNVGGFMAAGLLVLSSGFALRQALPAGRSSRIAAAAIAVFGLGLVLAGSFPCAPGCPQGTPTLHDGVSIAAFLSAIAGMGLAAHGLRADAAWRGLAGFSLVTSVTAAIFLVALVGSISSHGLTGLWQRLLVGTIFLWCGVVGLRAFRGLGASGAGPGKGSAGRSQRC